MADDWKQVAEQLRNDNSTYRSNYDEVTIAIVGRSSDMIS
jgi:hypothetical protein